MSTEPIRTVLIPIILACIAAAGQAFIDGATTRGIVTAVLGALVLAAQEVARRLVVPEAKLRRETLKRQVEPAFDRDRTSGTVRPAPWGAERREEQHIESERPDYPAR